MEAVTRAENTENADFSSPGKPKKPTTPIGVGFFGGDSGYRKRQTIDRLVTAAVRVCDHWNDSPAARQDMRQQIAEVPPEHRADLLAHFEREYPPQPKEDTTWA